VLGRQTARCTKATIRPPGRLSRLNDPRRAIAESGSWQAVLSPLPELELECRHAQPPQPAAVATLSPPGKSGFHGFQLAFEGSSGRSRSPWLLLRHQAPQPACRRTREEIVLSDYGCADPARPGPRIGHLALPNSIPGKEARAHLRVGQRSRWPLRLLVVSCLRRRRRPRASKALGATTVRGRLGRQPSLLPKHHGVGLVQLFEGHGLIDTSGRRMLSPDRPPDRPAARPRCG